MGRHVVHGRRVICGPTIADWAKHVVGGDRAAELAAGEGANSSHNRADFTFPAGSAPPRPTHHPRRRIAAANVETRPPGRAGA